MFPLHLENLCFEPLLTWRSKEWQTLATTGSEFPSSKTRVKLLLHNLSYSVNKITDQGMVLQCTFLFRNNFNILYHTFNSFSTKNEVNLGLDIIRVIGHKMGLPFRETSVSDKKIVGPFEF